ncbi:protein of unknown function [Legionella micdadei]|uniref:Uncharacterized protein n=1 Tax=Legionella micdadei TaxID=451 RepID=A0A098GDC9_LEGMI|nr:hypothetical protein Lmic_2170 [Legionella micdadei]CEG60025.1 protein of unknown function [Legionella micdadei]SCY61849.1 hypothetical protein SAMN02982997_02262 [Legionella micdadei]
MIFKYTFNTQNMLKMKGLSRGAKIDTFLIKKETYVTLSFCKNTRRVVITFKTKH